MKKIYLSVAVLAMFMASCRQEVKVENDGETKTDSTALDTSNTANAEAEKPRDSVAEMKAWQDYATPGETSQNDGCRSGFMDKRYDHVAFA
jgi:PBP1b-binding outer membrane lipoprotein LpoB